MTERQNVCVTCFNNTRMRPLQKYANMCIRCFGQSHLHFECRCCKSRKRHLSLHIRARKFKDADDLCLDCYMCIQCFQRPRDRRRGSKSLCTLCLQASSSSDGACPSSGASSTSPTSILERVQAAVSRGIVDGVLTPSYTIRCMARVEQRLEQVKRLRCTTCNYEITSSWFYVSASVF